jgi:hypothetical protein
MTRWMPRLLLASVVALTATACERDEPTAAPTAPAGPSETATPTPGPTTPPAATTTAPPSPTTDRAVVFAADGIGPYVIGTSLASLRDRSLVTGVSDSMLCDNAKSARATGRYASQLTLTFVSDRLVSVHTQSTALLTPSGARVGMTVPELDDRYGSRGTLITGSLGNKAFVVRVPASGLGIVFYLDPSNTRVHSMSGGEAQALEDAAMHGEGC